MSYRENCNNPEGNRRVDDPARWCSAKTGWSGRQCEKGCEVIDGKLTHEQWNENDSENFADSNDGYLLLKWGQSL